MPESVSQPLDDDRPKVRYHIDRLALASDFVSGLRVFSTDC